MATTRQVDAAAFTPKPPVIGGIQSDGHHILSGVTSPPEQQERTRAARRAISWGRTPNDPDADLVLDMLGLTHEDANPLPGNDSYGRAPAEAAKPAPVEPPRECRHCGVPKPAAQFHREAGGRAAWCKTCKNQARTQRRRQAAERTKSA